MATSRCDTRIDEQDHIHVRTSSSPMDSKAQVAHVIEQKTDECLCLRTARVTRKARVTRTARLHDERRPRWQQLQAEGARPALAPPSRLHGL